MSIPPPPPLPGRNSHFQAGAGEVSYRHLPPAAGGTTHSLWAERDGTTVGHLYWDKKEIRSVHVPEEHRHQGIATGLYNRATELAASGAAPTPKHSRARTLEGKQWSRAVGGKGAKSWSRRLKPIK